MCNNFGVGFAAKGDTVGKKFSAKFGEVFDDAVVDDSYFAILRKMRVGISVGGSTVGRPTSVADSGGACGHGICFELTLEVDEFAGLFASFDGAIHDDCDASRVISTVFESAKSLDNDP
jgi:hypothetical protein